MKKGEMLIESLISLIFISILLIPVSSSIRYLSKTNNNIDKKVINRINSLNLVEELKSLDYEKITKISGKHNFSNIQDVVNTFKLDSSHYILSDNNSYDILIRKTKYYYEINSKEYIYYLEVNKYEDYYIP